MNKFQSIAVVFFLFVNFITANNLFAQQDSSEVFPLVKDSITNLSPDQDSLLYGKDKGELDTKKNSKDTTGKHKGWTRPKKAMVWAMVLPGAGQAYNRKFWKLPILYAGAGVLAYFWITNQRGYTEFRRAYNYNYNILQDDPTYQVYEGNLKYGTSFAYTSINQLATERDGYRRYRDLSIAGSFILYAVSILDAYVDAHLSTFDLKNDLSLSVKPTFYSYNYTTFAPGLSISLNFNNNRITKNQLLNRDF